MKRREPEQLHMPEAEEPEYSLEDILREFGSPEAADGSAPAAPPVEAAQTRSMPAIVPPAPVPDRSKTIRFTPVVSPEPEKPAEEPIKEIPPEPAKKQQKAVKAPEQPPAEATRRKKPERAKAPQPAARPERADAPKAAPKPAHAAVKQAPAPKQPIRLIKTAAPPTPQEAFRRCRDGIGSTQLRQWLLFFLLFLQAFLLLRGALDWKLFPFLDTLSPVVSFVLLCLAVLLGYEVTLRAVRDLLTLHISLFTLTATAVALSLVDAVSCMISGGASYCAVAQLLLTVMFRAAVNEQVARFHTLRAVCSFDRPMGIFTAAGLARSGNGLRRDIGDVPDFMQQLSRRDFPQRFFSVYSTLLLPLTLLLALLLSARTDASFARLWMLLLFGAIPCGGMLSFFSPYAALARRVSAVGGALCGWHSAKTFGGPHTIILRDEDLFPRSHVTSNGMKLYGALQPARVIAYALAALQAAGNPLTELFDSLLQAQHGKRYPATTYRIYDNGGIGAEVAGDITLVGTMGFMRSMGVHMSLDARVRQAVYVSVNGELAGIFAVKYKPSASTRAGLRSILSNRRFSVVLATRDFLISPDLIAARYDVQTASLIYPAYSERLRLSENDPDHTHEQGALIAKDTFGAFAATVAAGNTLRLTSLLAFGLCLFAGVLGLIFCALLLIWDAAATASPLNLAAFHLLWSFFSSLVTFLMLRF